MAINRKNLATAAAIAGWLAAGPLADRLAARALTWVNRAFLAGEPVDEDDLFSETQAQQVIRRLEACEAHLVDLDERFGTHLHWLPTDGGRKWQQVSTTPKWQPEGEK